MLTVTLDPLVRDRIPTLQLGMLQADDVANRPHDPALWMMISELEEHLRHKWRGRTAAELPTIAATRRAYRALGDDPTRYRPSNEALLRRVLNRRAIPQINVVVDINTYVSLQSGLPLGCYDAAQIAAPVVLRCGQPGEHYEPIGKPAVDATNRLVLADQHGIFGSPTADSQRTMVTLQSQQILFVIFGFEAARAAVEHALTQTADLLQRFCDATLVDQQVVEATGDDGRPTTDDQA